MKFQILISNFKVHFTFFKGCLRQISLGPFLNILFPLWVTVIFFWYSLLNFFRCAELIVISFSGSKLFLEFVHFDFYYRSISNTYLSHPFCDLAFSYLLSFNISWKHAGYIWKQLSGGALTNNYSDKFKCSKSLAELMAKSCKSLPWVCKSLKWVCQLW